MFNIIIITSMYDNMYELKKTCNKLEIEVSDIKFNFFDAYNLDNDEKEYNKLLKLSENTRFVYMLLHGGVSNFKKFLEYREKFKEKIAFFIHSTIEDEIREFSKDRILSELDREKLEKYYILGGEKNYRNMFLYSRNLFSKIKYQIEEYEYPKFEGIYWNNDVIENFEEFKRDIAKNENVVGLLFHARDWQSKKIEVVNSFIENIKKEGGTPFPVFTNCIPDKNLKSRGSKWVLENYFKLGDKVIPKVIINLLGYSQSIFNEPGDGSEVVEKSIFEELDIPIIQTMTTYQSRKQWEEDIRGLDTMSLTTGVYYPEFDGQIISTTCCTQEIVEDEYGKRNIFLPIENRVNKISRMAMGWVKLAMKKNEDKKVAIILHNMPPRNDMIGCAFGLDTPNSVYNMVEEFSKIGIKKEYDFKNGDDIIQRIIKGVSNDQKWLSVEKVLEKSIDKIGKEKYKKWFKELEIKVQEKMEKQWGKAPGDFMVFDEVLPVPGILNGNMFIGLQPARGNIAKADEMYHNTDILMPHQYYSFYKWIKEEFKADVIYHVGTHGTLEWLPGKEIGLSRKCCPDFCLDDIPHLYDYSVNVTGEGLQAKRRSNAVLISYMIPALTLAGEYEEIEELDELIKQYYQAENSKDRKLEEIKNSIVNKVFNYKYDLDLKLTREEIEKDYKKFINQLHSYIEELKSSVIKDGLHILGEKPTGERYITLVQALMRLDNKGMMSAEKSVAKAMGIDIEELEREPYNLNIDGKTNLMLRDEIRNITTSIIRNILEKKDLNLDYDIKDDSYIEKLKKNIVERVIPKLEEVTRELISTRKGVEGKFILPGQSGCPTRGNIDILPTGTNFYSIDPNKIPSRAAWKTGVMLAEDLLRRYLEDEGKLPENIAMLIYGGETMKTYGDDIAEALYLMGVKPVWLNNGDRVIGLEVIPYEELKRPRIDVTFRITGLFRDTFPILIKLLEEAVNLVSQLDEDENINYLKKSINKDMKKLIEEGCNAKEAEQKAKMRIFGCPPGTYGAGVGVLINSQKWETREDLGKAYVNWSSHAYGKDYHGIKVENIFIERMKNTQVTIKNESSVEIDMLESDDYYTYHGGLVAAVKYASGKNPQSYSGDASDPNKTKIRNLKEETARIMRARILNPKWFDGLKRHGYKGAQEVGFMVDIFFGWDATSEIAEDWMYDRITETYIENEKNREWIKNSNPHALMNMAERLLEANQRNMWNASKEKIDALQKIYLDIEGDIEDYED
ncbi:cobaltochelatase subunit CobN [uncultured Fusobacterium sp.]|uniref:cobaltochelatase subunit CobN n=1 Tax=uncultured Fusobacterium sp. TaxID=159267 RepID=UPI0025E9AB10|nr:cobaltochelatase subunit CobN [uncultured Fusobacterium sp.]